MFEAIFDDRPLHGVNERDETLDFDSEIVDVPRGTRRYRKVDITERLDQPVMRGIVEIALREQRLDAPPFEIELIERLPHRPTTARRRGEVKSKENSVWRRFRWT